MSDNFIWFTIFVVIMVIALSGCAWGPVQITHEAGSMPKAKVNLPYDGRITMRNYKEVWLAREWEF